MVNISHSHEKLKSYKVNINFKYVTILRNVVLTHFNVLFWHSSKETKKTKGSSNRRVSNMIKARALPLIDLFSFQNKNIIQLKYKIPTIERHIQDFKKISLCCCRVDSFWDLHPRFFVIFKHYLLIISKESSQLYQCVCPIIIPLILHCHSGNVKKMK